MTTAPKRVPGGKAAAPKRAVRGRGADPGAAVEPPPKRARGDGGGAGSGGGRRGPAVTEAAVLAGTVPFERATTDADFDGAAMLKLVTWNVAGLRALLRRGTQLQSLVAAEAPDVLCLQETRLSDLAECPALAALPGYTHVDSVSTARKGYSGTRTYVRDGLGAVHHSFEVEGLRGAAAAEGRAVVSSVPGLSVDVVNTYVPNSGLTLDRLEYRCGAFDPALRAVLAARCAGGGRVVWAGDLNVAERDFDRFFGGSFRQMQRAPGFTPEERASFRTTLAETKMVDAFRQVYPTARGTYTFWSARFNQRAKGHGWRLDYFVVSAALAARVVDCFPLPAYSDSDHCPVVLWLRK